jgi:hypothetical protein
MTTLTTEHGMKKIEAAIKEAEDFAAPKIIEVNRMLREAQALIDEMKTHGITVALRFGSQKRLDYIQVVPSLEAALDVSAFRDGR